VEEEAMVWVLVAVIVILLAVVGLLLMRQQRSRQLKQGFGPEYDRVIAQTGDQRVGERELRERRHRREEYAIAPLEAGARVDYTRRWEETQRHFVDDPAGAVDQADVLLQRVMGERGYPADADFDRRAADISVDHPVVVENYRAAHSISERSRGGQASTEELRQAMKHFRALFDDLLAPSTTTDARAAERQNVHETAGRR
jgi:hypothetical protein